MSTRLDEPATGRQLRLIAVLCMKHGISEPVEEKPLTKGEAGRLIRRLTGQRIRRNGSKGLKSQDSR